MHRFRKLSFRPIPPITVSRWTQGCPDFHSYGMEPHVRRAVAPERRLEPDRSSPTAVAERA
ncbi:hypothetical protein HMPREF0724_13996 [Prescottella equi ATCC 33707]|uniref:Uncharacterized protein n=1 Tax=Prescottella equi ATCC 33707 TaxID=525370 RepID=F1TJU3_RHOHA|nr:hypothetical protein HMPREF0724_13996 [Prescottella equi ATCC 33707]